MNSGRIFCREEIRVAFLKCKNLLKWILIIVKIEICKVSYSYHINLR